MKKRIVAYLLAVIVTYLVAVILVSQFNISRVAEMGMDVGMADRLGAIAHDLKGMIGLYLPIIAVGLLIAFTFTGLLLLRFIDSPGLLYPLAGFVAIVAVHVILKGAFDLTPIAPTRTLIGLVCQGLAGGLGGYVYNRMRLA